MGVMKGIASPYLPIYRDKLSEGGDEERREGEGELKSNRVRQVNAGNTIRQLAGQTENVTTKLTGCGHRMAKVPLLRRG